jgi:hypothetical protein
MLCCAICFVHMSNQLRSSPNYPMCSRASSSKSFVWCWIVNIAEIAVSLVVSDCHRILMLWMQVFGFELYDVLFVFSDCNWINMLDVSNIQIISSKKLKKNQGFSIQLFNTVTRRFYVALVGMQYFVVMEKGPREKPNCALALCENDLWLPSTMFSQWQPCFYTTSDYSFYAKIEDALADLFYLLIRTRLPELVIIITFWFFLYIILSI